MANFKLVNISGGDLSYKSFRMRKDEARDVVEVPALVTELNGLNPQKTYVSVIALTGVVEDTPVVVDDTAEREAAAKAEADRLASEQAEAQRLADEQAAAEAKAEEDARLMRELEEQEAARLAAEAAAKQEETAKQEPPKVEKTDKKK